MDRDLSRSDDRLNIVGTSMFWLPRRSAGPRQTDKNTKPEKTKMLSSLAEQGYELMLRTNTMNGIDEHHEFQPEWKAP